LRGMYVQFFDHNVARLGVFCPYLVYRQAALALDLIPGGPRNFDWCCSASRTEALQEMACVAHMPPHLTPSRFSCVPVSEWKVGVPVFLPKWKAPGNKWRMIINKHATPCSGLHSLVCRAIDTLLDHLPRDEWSDYGSPQELLDLCKDFNRRLFDRFHGKFSSWTESGDMHDCFHHLPVQDAVNMWDSVVEHFHMNGVRFVSVPARSGVGKGRLGKFEDAGWIALAFDDIRSALAHFSDTNYVCVGSRLGRECKGAPQGDALSSAVLRLFKWWREHCLRLAESRSAIHFPGTCTKLVYVKGTNI
jgi:hypothetical protein